MVTRRIRFTGYAATVLLALTGVTSLSTNASAEGDPVIFAAGDIACPPSAARTATGCHQADTAALIAGGGAYDAVLPIGDEQYNCGELSAFQSEYEATWGQFNANAYPVVGDNEYSGSTCITAGAAGYYTYFGNRASPGQPGCTSDCKGYYSYKIGAWHLVALNSECTQAGVGGCAATDPMATWLKDDLAANPTTCSLAYMHRPYWATSGVSTKYKPIVQILYDAGVDVLLVGHNHVYTRFARQDPNSNVDPNGIRQFTVGTGGKGHGSLNTVLANNIDAQDAKTFGVLKLTLHPSSYDFAFVPDSTPGTFADSGTQQQCSTGGPPVQQAPIVSTGDATGLSSTAATLNGTVNPQGSETTYKFQYGTTASYGTPTSEATAGAGSTLQNVSETITGLTPATTYHYRLVATNPAGTTTGDDQTFTTSAASGGDTPGQVTSPKIVSGSTTDRPISVTVRYGAPTSGPAPTGYRITVIDQTTSDRTTVLVAASLLRVKISGLVNGDYYQAEITAFNGAGDGPPVSTTTQAIAR